MHKENVSWCVETVTVTVAWTAHNANLRTCDCQVDLGCRRVSLPVACILTYPELLLISCLSVAWWFLVALISIVSSMMLLIADIVWSWQHTWLSCSDHPWSTHTGTHTNTHHQVMHGRLHLFKRSVETNVQTVVQTFPLLSQTRSEAAAGAIAIYAWVYVLS
jgi:hypothetical protein